MVIDFNLLNSKLFWVEQYWSKYDENMKILTTIIKIIIIRKERNNNYNEIKIVQDNNDNKITIIKKLQL